MTNAEIYLAKAKKLLRNGDLNTASSDFIESIQYYDKKELNKLSHKQYKWLRDIAQELA